MVRKWIDERTKIDKIFFAICMMCLAIAALAYYFF